MEEVCQGLFFWISPPYEDLDERFPAKSKRNYESTEISSTKS
jgi:hypothetical protein